MDMEDIMEKEQNSQVGMVYLTTILDDMWRGLKKFYWVFLLIISVASSLFYVQAKKSYTPVYQAYSSFVVNSKTAYAYDTTYYNKATASQMSKTFPYILTSGALNQVVAESLGLDYVPATITAEAMEDTALFTIKVTASNPQMAYDVLQAVIENYPVVAEYIIGDTQLTLMDESGIPESPMNAPDYMSGARNGFIVGLLFSVVILVLYAVMRNTVRREDDLKKRLSIKSLGSIPNVKMKKRSQENTQSVLISQENIAGILGEGLRTIRTRVIKEAEAQENKVIMVTSAAAGEGKTTFTANLGISLARKGKRVIIIDLDMRNPSVAALMGIDENGYGITDVLKGKAEVEKVLYPYGDTSLSIIPCTQCLSNPGKLLGCGRMETLLAELSDKADYILLDTPPCGMISDASLIARYAQAAIFVIRQDYTRIERVIASVDTLSDTGVKLLGYVLNGTEVGITGYGHGYGYGYGYGYGRYGHGRYGYGKKYGYGEKKNERGRWLKSTDETPDEEKKDESKADEEKTE